MGRLTLRFNETAAERAFGEAQAASAVFYVRLLSGLTALFSFLFAVIAPLVVPQATQFRGLLFTGLLPILATLCVGFGLTYSPRFPRLLQPVAVTGTLMTTLGMVWL